MNLQKTAEGREGATGVRRDMYLADLNQSFHGFRNP